MDTTYIAHRYYVLEPHAHCATQDNGSIPIETIAERVYGKPYSSLRGCQRDQESLPNDSVKLYELESDDHYEQALHDFDRTEVYLGYDRLRQESVTRTGMTQLDYWLSISVSTDPTKVTVQADAPETTDLAGAVFPDRFDADLAFTPSLEGILADLIRRGELPRGRYIFRHWW
ncbi:hypothetical protein C8K30_1011062 [Promicromonospora sp. AC04]|uniref:hypothetical protein n=1 Tax=Promicromonospora sp. AC04 TaxID=2135723 RepID=UPI000D37FDF5|nr:hypothetical protein [Promicromonospora sp. AC04]PUB32536.1 hypothetical protein C8K30_1011062 [Promicromonospora sp. AC04]